MSPLRFTANGMFAGVRNTVPSAGLPRAIGGLIGGGKQCVVEQHWTRFEVWRDSRKHSGLGHDGSMQTLIGPSSRLVWSGCSGGTRWIISGVKVRQLLNGS